MASSKVVLIAVSSTRDPATTNTFRKVLGLKEAISEEKQYSLSDF